MIDTSPKFPRCIVESLLNQRCDVVNLKPAEKELVQRGKSPIWAKGAAQDRDSA